jgi:universal stress protein A
MKAKPAKHPGEIVLQLNRRDEPLMAIAGNVRKPSPFRLKNILVPIDFSDCSKKALQYAIPLAQEHDAKLTAVYVVPTTYGVGEYGGIDYSSIRAEARIHSEMRLADLVAQEVACRVPTDTLVCSGSPAPEIVEAAKDLPADLIVISTHGYSGLKSMFLGRVAEHVVRAAPCPVLVVRENEHEFLAN